jgi:hypothetical protein
MEEDKMIIILKRNLWNRTKFYSSSQRIKADLLGDKKFGKGPTTS